MNCKHIFSGAGKSSLTFLDAVNTLIKLFQHNGVKLSICDDFHVSLTRTIVLRHHWIEGFIASIKKQLSDFKRFLKCLHYIQMQD